MTKEDNKQEIVQERLINCGHFKKILYLSMPTVLSAILTFCVEIVNIAFIGNLNDSHMLAGVGMGNMMVNGLWVAVYMGLNGALETLVSQSFGGKNWYLCGDILNRGWIVLFLIYIPVGFSLYFISDILIAAHVDPMTAQYASIYSRNMMIGLYAQALFDLCRKFMIMMALPVIPTIIQIVTLPMHITFCYVFINQQQMGVKGVGIATQFTFLLNFIFIITAVFLVKNTRQCLNIPRKETFQRLWEYFVLGVPTAIMVCMDIWAFSVLTFISHFLGVDENAGQVILLNVLSVLYSIPMGFASGACALVGRNIGKGKVEKAKAYAKQSILLVVLVSLIPCICFSAMPRQIILIFTSNEVVIDACMLTMYWSSLGFQADVLQGTMQGVLKGVELQGRAWYGSLMNYVIGLPLAYLLAFTLDFKLAGLWIGLYFAQAFVFVFFFVLCKYANWQKQVEKAQYRIEMDGKQNNIEGKLLPI